MLLLLSPVHAWAAACGSQTTVCELDVAIGYPGQTGILGHATVTNNAAQDCDITIQYFALGNTDPTVTIANAPPPTSNVPANGGTFEFDIEMSIDASSSAEVAEVFYYFVEVCSATYQFLSIIPTNELSWDAASPPALSGFSAEPWGGWDCSILASCGLKFFGAKLAPSPNSFTGRWIQEWPGGAVIDYCWNQDVNHVFAKAALTPRAPWQVQEESYYAHDRVGFSTEVINHYRSIGVAPCTAIVPQRMSMLSFEYPNITYYPTTGYTTHNLLWGIDRDCAFNTVSGEVAVKRDNNCDSKQF